MKDQFIKRFKEIMTGTCGVADGCAIAAGLSGGPDSVALVSALATSGYPTLALHVNFHLRGQESDRDECCAAEVAHRLGIRFLSTSVDVAAFRTDHPGMSVEMACRELRYQWFRKIQLEESISILAIAHHSDDNAETMLLNLMRGSGIKGLRGMLPRSNGIIRPLLQFSRKEIMEYVSTTGLPYVIDSSNLTNDYRRNQLRNDIIPRIRHHFPDADHAISHTIANLGATESLLDELTDKAKANYVSSDRTIDLRKLADEVANASTLLYWWLRPHGFNHSQCDDMVAAVGRETASGQRFTTGCHQAIVDRGRLYINQVNTTTVEAAVFCPVRLDSYPASVEAKVIPTEEVAFSRDATTIFLDYDRVAANGCDFELRPPERGDRISPFGMNGSRLVSDIIAEAHLPPTERNAVRVLILGDKTLWVTGLRASRHYPVTTATRHVLRLRYHPD